MLSDSTILKHIARQPKRSAGFKQLVRELGLHGNSRGELDALLQKLVAAGITTVESLADMTPEQLEEIPGIGEKTLERISVAVRHYFGHFEEGEEGHVPESLDAEAEEAGEGVSVERAVEEEPGTAEIMNADAVAGQAQAEEENAAETMEEAEMVRSAEAETDELDRADAGSESLVEEQAETESMTMAELAVENVPLPDDVEPLDLEPQDGEAEEKDEK